jgi:hypothetical protein
MKKEGFINVHEQEQIAWREWKMEILRQASLKTLFWLNLWFKWIEASSI